MTPHQMAALETALRSFADHEVGRLRSVPIEVAEHATRTAAAVAVALATGEAQRVEPPALVVDHPRPRSRPRGGGLVERDGRIVWVCGCEGGGR